MSNLDQGLLENEVKSIVELVANIDPTSDQYEKGVEEATNTLLVIINKAYEKGESNE
jgi:hypothetical protein